MEQVKPEIKDSRAHEALALSDILRKEFLKAQIGKTVNVLFETEKENVAFGYTENYIPVKVSNSSSLKNEIREVKITDLCDDYVIGELCTTR